MRRSPCRRGAWAVLGALAAIALAAMVSAAMASGAAALPVSPTATGAGAAPSAWGTLAMASAGSVAAPPPGPPGAAGAAHPVPVTGGNQLPGGHMASGQAQAAPADVASPDAVLRAFYEAISGPPGKKRDWNRFLSLFFPGARLLPAEGKGHAGVMPEVFSPSNYLYDTEPYMLQAGYVVKETARRSESFGKIAQVFSTYAVRHAEGDAKPFVRGINSFQLFFDGSRWWIFSLAWQPETPRLPLPAQYLR